jgi:hypothetical protein
MAKYGDYARGIEREIDDAHSQSNQRARDAKTGRFVPDRFKGKSVEDVIQSYEQLEKLNSRQSQDLGQMRKTVDQLLEVQRNQALSPGQAPSKPVSVDDLYEDADGNIRRIAKEELSGEIETLKSELNQLRVERKMSHLDTKFEDWRQEVMSPEFTEWVGESPYRQRMYRDADNGDFDAAEEILGMYYELRRRQDDGQEQEVQQRATEQQLNDAILETGSPAPVSTEDTYSRHDLMEARLAAKRGDQKAERWLQAHSESIALAYEEGRIVD